MIEVEVVDRQDVFLVNASRLADAARAVFRSAGVNAATLSIAVVDDAEMQRLNLRHLNHDFPTDVLSFAFSEREEPLEGEIIVSAETAQAVAARLPWSREDELLLYVVHGALHLVGHDDHTPAERAAMRRREREILADFGLSPPYEAECEPDS